MSLHPCAICKGACCDSLVFPAPAFTQEGDFLSVRGTRTDSGRVEVESRCPKLTDCGSCSIHEHRPAVCRYFAVGGPRCLETVKRRRTGQQLTDIIAAIDALPL
jgi:Fe-S-cluster containining protein